MGLQEARDVAGAEQAVAADALQETQQPPLVSLLRQDGLEEFTPGWGFSPCAVLALTAQTAGLPAGVPILLRDLPVRRDLKHLLVSISIYSFPGRGSFANEFVHRL